MAVIIARRNEEGHGGAQAYLERARRELAGLTKASPPTKYLQFSKPLKNTDYVPKTQISPDYGYTDNIQAMFKGQILNWQCREG